MRYPGTHRHIDDPAAVGARIHTLRKRQGLTLEQLSGPGASAGFLGRIERGNRAPSETLIRELAAGLGTTPEWLAWGEHGTAVDPAGAEFLLAALGVESLHELRRLVGVARAYEHGRIH